MIPRIALGAVLALTAFTVGAQDDAVARSLAATCAAAKSRSTSTPASWPTGPPATWKRAENWRKVPPLGRTSAHPTGRPSSAFVLVFSQSSYSVR